MRGFKLSVWLMVPLLGTAYHYGPGQERLKLDDVQGHLSLARASVDAGEYTQAVKSFTTALAAIPAERKQDVARIRVERAKAMLHAQRLPEAYDELTLLLPELQDDPDTDPALLADAREGLANSKYYLTWLMRLEGEPRTEWEPEIEASRQTYRLLAEQAAANGEDEATRRHQEDLEAAIRLARMDLTDLQALPLPSQCRGCCSGECQCKGKGKGRGKGEGKSQKKEQGDKFARGASSGPPPDGGGN